MLWKKIYKNQGFMGVYALDEIDKIASKMSFFLILSQVP